MSIVVLLLGGPLARTRAMIHGVRLLLLRGERDRNLMSTRTGANGYYTAHTGFFRFSLGRAQSDGCRGLAEADHSTLTFQYKFR